MKMEFRVQLLVLLQKYMRMISETEIQIFNLNRLKQNYRGRSFSMKYDLNISAETLSANIKRLINQTYKLLPNREEGLE